MIAKIAKTPISRQSISKEPVSRANLIDVHVGRRIRILRTEKTLSLTALADKLGISYQQIQKYESGTNRVGASKLFELARALEVDIAAFYSGLEVGQAGNISSDAQERAAFASTPDGVRMLDSLRSLPRHAQRMTLGMITALADCFRSSGHIHPPE